MLSVLHCVIINPVKSDTNSRSVRQIRNVTAYVYKIHDRKTKRLQTDRNVMFLWVFQEMGADGLGLLFLPGGFGPSEGVRDADSVRVHTDPN